MGETKATEESVWEDKGIPKSSGVFRVLFPVSFFLGGEVGSTPDDAQV